LIDSLLDVRFELKEMSKGSESSHGMRQGKGRRRMREESERERIIQKRERRRGRSLDKY